MALSEAESALNVRADGEVVLNVGSSRTFLGISGERKREGEREDKRKRFPKWLGILKVQYRHYSKLQEKTKAMSMLFIRTKTKVSKILEFDLKLITLQTDNALEMEFNPCACFIKSND